MTRILVIAAHPQPHSLCAGLADAYADAARQQGAEVEVLRLAELRFDPVLRHGHHGEQPLEEDLQRAQQLLTWCDHLCIATPLWWGAAPALLKGFFDRALLPGFAFKYTKGPFPRRLLSGRSARLLITSDSPAWYLRLFMGDSAVRAITDSTLRFCGFGPVRVSRFGPVRSSTPEKRDQWLRHAAHLARQDHRRPRPTQRQPALG